MRALCTYCSATKDPAQGLLPAGKRYLSSRILRVRQRAEREGACLYILSGEFGLVDWDQPIPWYDHLLLREEVPRLAKRVSLQLIEKSITQVDYYTRSGSISTLIPYLETIQQGCQVAEVNLHIKTLEGSDMSSTLTDWNEIVRMSVQARETLKSARASGEQEFEKLMARCPGDGWPHLERARAYRDIGELGLAVADYDTAERLLPYEKYKRVARQESDRVMQDLKSVGRASESAGTPPRDTGSIPVRTDRVPEVVSAVPEVSGTLAEARLRVKSLTKLDQDLCNETLSAIDKVKSEPRTAAGQLRQLLESVLETLLAQHHITPDDLSEDRIFTSIAALKPYVPEMIIHHMHAIRIVGNKGTHRPKEGQPPLQPRDVYPGVDALVAVLEWLSEQES